MNWQRRFESEYNHPTVGVAASEQVYLRHEQGDYLAGRAKVVSDAFKQQIEEHWTRRPVVPYQLALAHV